MHFTIICCFKVTIMHKKFVYCKTVPAKTFNIYKKISVYGFKANRSWL